MNAYCTSLNWREIKLSELSKNTIFLHTNLQFVIKYLCICFISHLTHKTGIYVYSAQIEKKFKYGFFSWHTLPLFFYFSSQFLFYAELAGSIFFNKRFMWKYFCFRVLEILQKQSSDFSVYFSFKHVIYNKIGI